MGHAEWKRIAEDIRDNYDKYNAFLILHGAIEKILCNLFNSSP